MARSVLQPYTPKKRYIPKNTQQEQGLQSQVCSYLRLQYPHVIFRSDYASGLKLTAYQAKTHQRLQYSRSWPDIFIYHPMKVDGVQYAGLALELKKEGTIVYKKDGSLRKKTLTRRNRYGLVAEKYDHLAEQADMLEKLRKRGYMADFAVGFDDAVNKIDHYMGKPENIGLAF